MSHRYGYYEGPTSGVSSYFRSHYGYGSRYRRGYGRRFRESPSHRSYDLCGYYDDYDYDW